MSHHAPLPVDLRSDTVTRPTPAMRAAMHEAPTGDDVFAEDPTMNALQERVADMFGHEAALFFPSGTMANQAAIQVHTRPGDEVICGHLSHIYHYEGGGMARNSGASVRLIGGGGNGTFSGTAVRSAVNPPDAHYARTALVAAEDTVNKGGGAVWSLQAIADVRAEASALGLPFHLDGARCWNAQVARGCSTADLAAWRAYGQHFDSLSICFSKGLGCPVGSVLIGSRAFIAEAHRSRKVLGGGMRQVGVLAAACLHALDHHVDRMQIDHEAAKRIGETARRNSFVEKVDPVETNIVIFHLVDGLAAENLQKDAEAEGILCFPFGPSAVRMVTHLDIQDIDIARTCDFLSQWRPEAV
jgi:threonine aldolase